MGKRCVVFGCDTTSHSKSGVTAFRFPKEYSPTRRLWIKFVQVTRNNAEFNPTPNSVICAKHFTADCFEGNQYTTALKSALGRSVKPQLKNGARPTVYHRKRKVPTGTRSRGLYNAESVKGDKQARSPPAPSAAPEQASMSDEAVKKDYVVIFTEDFPSPDVAKASFPQLNRHHTGVFTRLRHLSKSTGTLAKPLVAEVAVQCSLISAPPLNVFPATSVSAQKLGTTLSDQAEHLRPFDHEDSRQPGDGAIKDTETSQQDDPSVCFKTEPVDLDTKPMVHDISATLNLNACYTSYAGCGARFKTETVEVVRDSCCPSAGVPALADEHQTSRSTSCKREDFDVVSEKMDTCDEEVCVKTEPWECDENDTETVQSCSACKQLGRSRRSVPTDRIFADTCESSDIDKHDSSFCGLKMECDNAYDSDSNASTSQKSNVSTERQNVAHSLGGDCVSDYTCQQCGAELSPFDLTVEMQNSSLKLHKCEECGSAFASASNLAHHVIMRSHAGGEKCRCLHCGGLFQGTKKMKLNNFVVEKEKEGNSLMRATIGTVHEGVVASMEEKRKFAVVEKLVVLEGSSVSTEAEKKMCIC